MSKKGNQTDMDTFKGAISQDVVMYRAKIRTCWYKGMLGRQLVKPSSCCALSETSRNGCCDVISSSNDKEQHVGSQTRDLAFAFVIPRCNSFNAAARRSKLVE